MAITLTYSGKILAETGETVYNNTYGDLNNDAIQYLDDAVGRVQCSGTIAYPEDKDYILILKSRWAGTIKSAVFKTDAGTLTAAVKIDTTAVTSLSAIAVTTSESDTASTGANSMVAGNDLRLTLSGVTGCDALYYNIWIDRTSEGTA
jgi:hypothetical protein